MTNPGAQGAALWEQYAKVLNGKLDAAFEAIGKHGAQVSIPAPAGLRETLAIRGETNAIQNER